MIINDNENIKIKSCYKPKRKPNLVRWMTKHNVSCDVMSTPYAISRAIDSVVLEEEIKNLKDENRN